MFLLYYKLELTLNDIHELKLIVFENSSQVAGEHCNVIFHINSGSQNKKESSPAHHLLYYLYLVN